MEHLGVAARVSSRHVIHHVTLEHVTSHYVAPHYVKSHCRTPEHGTSHHMIVESASSNHVKKECDVNFFITEAHDVRSQETRAK